MNAIEFATQIGLKILSIEDDGEGQRGLLFICNVPSDEAAEKVTAAVKSGAFDKQYLRLYHKVVQNCEPVVSGDPILVGCGVSATVYLFFTPEALEILQQVDCVQKVSNRFKNK